MKPLRKTSAADDREYERVYKVKLMRKERDCTKRMSSPTMRWKTPTEAEGNPTEYGGFEPPSDPRAPKPGQPDRRVRGPGPSMVTSGSQAVVDISIGATQTTPPGVTTTGTQTEGCPGAQCRGSQTTEAWPQPREPWERRPFRPDPPRPPRSRPYQRFSSRDFIYRGQGRDRRF